MRKLSLIGIATTVMVASLAGMAQSVCAANAPSLDANAGSSSQNQELLAFQKAIRAKYDMKEKAWAARDAETIVTKFYTEDVVSVGEAEGMFFGREKIRPLYEEVVQKYTIHIESVRSFVRGNAGWDWADFEVTPRDPNQKPATLAMLFVWAKVGGQWMCKGESYVFGSLRTGKVTGPPAELGK